MDYRHAAFALLASVTASSAFAGVDATYSSTIVNDPRFWKTSTEPACNTLQMASTGGPTLSDAKTLAIRWLGYSNYELIYGDKIILLDHYYNRGPRYKDLGFKVTDVTRADLMIVGHAHYDHMSDTAQVGAQTGAPIMGAPITISKLMTQPVNPRQLIQVTGTTNEVMRFDGFTVQPILGRHGEPPSNIAGPFNTAYTASIPPATPSEAAAESAINARGSTDAHIVDQGTIAFVITFDSGFRLAYRDSGGIMTDNEKNAMQQIGRVDVLLGAVAANVIAESQATIMLPMVQTYRPAVLIPGHHEEHLGNTVDRATEPLFQYVKNAYPNTVTVSQEFREPICFNTRRNISSGTADVTGYDGTPAVNQPFELLP